MFDFKLRKIADDIYTNTLNYSGADSIRFAAHLIERATVEVLPAGDRVVLMDALEAAYESAVTARGYSAPAI